MRPSTRKSGIMFPSGSYTTSVKPWAARYWYTIFLDISTWAPRTANKHTPGRRQPGPDDVPTSEFHRAPRSPWADSPDCRVGHSRHYPFRAATNAAVVAQTEAWSWWNEHRGQLDPNRPVGQKCPLSPEFRSFPLRQPRLSRPPDLLFPAIRCLLYTSDAA